VAKARPHLPPRTADKPQGKVEQVKDALKKDEGPPKAQPTPQETGKRGGKT